MKKTRENNGITRAFNLISVRETSKKPERRQGIEKNEMASQCRKRHRRAGPLQHRKAIIGAHTKRNVFVKTANENPSSDMNARMPLWRYEQVGLSLRRTNIPLQQLLQVK